VESVYSAVRTDSLYKADYVSSFKGKFPFFPTQFQTQQFTCMSAIRLSVIQTRRRSCRLSTASFIIEPVTCLWHNWSNDTGLREIKLCLWTPLRIPFTNSGNLSLYLYLRNLLLSLDLCCSLHRSEITLRLTVSLYNSTFRPVYPQKFETFCAATHDKDSSVSPQNISISVLPVQLYPLTL
jgi:hypothetical protein